MTNSVKKLAQFGAVIFASLTSTFTLANAAQAWETFRVNGDYALNVHSLYGTLDGQTKVSTYKFESTAKYQQFERLQGNKGGTLLKNNAAGKCMNAHYLYNGAPVNVWDCNPDDPDQNFNIKYLGGGNYQIQRTGTNFCIDSPYRENGGKIHLWECDTNNVNQRWYSSNHSFTRLSFQSKATNRVMDAGGSNFSLYMYPNLVADNPYHNWRAVPSGVFYSSSEQYFYLLSDATGRVLDGGGSNGTQPYQHPTLMKGNPYQMWKFTKSGDDYYIVNQATNRVLDAGGSNGTLPYMYPNFIAGNAYHLWRLPTSPNPSTGQINLPFGSGQTWYVCQGYQNSISHGNTFGLDLTVTNQDFGSTGCWAHDKNWSKSAGKSVLAPLSGTISHVGQDLVCLSIDANRSLLIGHMSNRVAAGTKVSAGQQIGTVSAASSVNGNYAHIHLEGRRSSNCASGTSVPLTAANGLSLSNVGDLADLTGTNDHFKKALTRP